MSKKKQVSRWYTHFTMHRRQHALAACRLAAASAPHRAARRPPPSRRASPPPPPRRPPPPAQGLWAGRRVPEVDEGGAPILYARYSSVDEVLQVRSRARSARRQREQQLLHLLANKALACAAFT